MFRAEPLKVPLKKSKGFRRVADKWEVQVLVGKTWTSVGVFHAKTCTIQFNEGTPPVPLMLMSFLEMVREDYTDHHNTTPIRYTQDANGEVQVHFFNQR